MPYIERSEREMLDDGIIDISTPGQLNYCFTQVILQYIDVHGLDYRTINDIIGALEGAKLEFYRRVAAPYENTKIKMNGDVYGEDNEMSR